MTTIRCQPISKSTQEDDVHDADVDDEDDDKAVKVDDDDDDYDIR